MSYTAHLIPAGLHPQLSISTTAPPCECDLYAHLPLAPSFIPDRFQLAQLHTEGRLGSYDPASSEGTLRVGGSRDLEGPLRGAEGSEVLLRLSEGRRDMKGKGREMEMVEVEVPLHLRYQRPVQERWVGGERADTVQVELEWPRVFWACEDDREPPADSPPCPPLALPSSFNVTSHSLHFLTPSSLPPSTLCPPSLPLPLTLTAPTGVIADLPLVETVNFAVIWLGMLSVGWWAIKARSRTIAGLRGKEQGKGE